MDCIAAHVRVRAGIANGVWNTTEGVIYNTVNQKCSYNFHKVHSTTCDNKTLFRSVEPLLQKAVDGFHVTVMAYGQTGSGKTHSMLGSPKEPGIVPRTADFLLAWLHETRRYCTDEDITIGVSVTEIYNDVVRDLLDPSCKKLQVKDAATIAEQTGSTLTPIQSFEDFDLVTSTAFANRKTGVTNLNEYSSRSHMILTFEVTRKHRQFQRIRKGSISLVDLAGSESASRANTTGVQLQEGGHINQSLLSLGNVVTSIVEGKSHIPFRESNLTRLLRQSLSGSGLTLVLCCVNPSRENEDQTKASLQFAQRAMRIKIDAVKVAEMPPLFMAQFQRDAHIAFGLDVAKLSEVYYQRGIYDAYMSSNATVNSLLSEQKGPLSVALHSMMNLQRCMLLNDQAVGLEQLQALQAELRAAEDAVSRGHTTKGIEQKRLREQDMALEMRKSKLHRLERQVDDREKEAEAKVAEWECSLEDTKRHQVGDIQVLLAEEGASRSELECEHISGVVKALQPFLETLRELMQADLDERLDADEPSQTSSLNEDDEIFKQQGSSSSFSQVRHPLYSLSTTTTSASSAFGGDAVTRAQEESRDLRSDIEDRECAYQMLRDEFMTDDEDEALSQCTNTQRLAQYNSTATEDLERLLLSLESEEQRLRASSMTEVRQEANKKAKESLQRGVVQNQRSIVSHSRTPVKQGGGAMAPPSPACVGQVPQQQQPVARPTYSDPRPSSSYVSPYSQKALLRSPAGAAPRASPSYFTSASNTSKVSAIGMEVRNAGNVLRDVRNRLLGSPMSSASSMSMSTSSIVMAAPPLSDVENEEAKPQFTRSTPLGNRKATNVQPVAANQKCLTPPPPLSPSKSLVAHAENIGQRNFVTIIDDDEGEDEIVGIVARRKAAEQQAAALSSQQPQRPVVVERILFNFSLSPQMEVNYARAKPTTRKATTRSKS